MAPVEARLRLSPTLIPFAAAVLGPLVFGFSTCLADGVDRQLGLDAAGNVVEISQSAVAEGAPQLFAFDPLFGHVGDQLTLYGDNLAGSAELPTVYVGDVAAPVVTSKSGQLTVVVPAGARSGHVRIESSLGQAQSPTPFLVIPASVDAFAADTVEPQGAESHLGFLEDSTRAVSFYADQGELFTLNVLGWSGNTAYLNVQYIAPNGSETSLGNGRNYPDSFNLAPVTQPGEHWLVFRATEQGVAKLELVNNPILTKDGPPSTASAQDQLDLRVGIPATAGDSFAVGVSDLSVSAGGFTRFKIYSPSGARVASFECRRNSYDRCNAYLSQVPEDGVYDLVASPVRVGANIESVSLWSSSDLLLSGLVSGENAIDIPRPGQRAVLEFEQPITETVRLALSSLSLDAGGYSAQYQALTPSGRCVRSSDCSQWSRLGLNSVVELPPEADGIASIRVGAGDDGLQSGSGAMTLVASTAYKLALAADAEASSFDGLLQGQSVEAEFSVDAGDAFGVGLTGIGFQPRLDNAEFSIIAPNGEVLGEIGCGRSYSIQCHGHVANAPESGVYKIIGHAKRGSTHSMAGAFWLTTDLTYQANLDQPINVALDRPGAKANINLNQPFLEPITLRVSERDFTPTRSTVLFQVVAANGECVPRADCATWSMLTRESVDLPSHPSGIATVRIAPAGNRTNSGAGSMTVLLESGN
jgi:hypothetical protein